MTSRSDHRPDMVTAYSPMAEVEERLGIEPIEMLLDKRRTLINKVAVLRALYGPFGTWEHIRKNELARIAGLLRAEAVRDGIKRTEAATDDLAHAHAEYVGIVTTATSERADWVQLESEIEAIEHQIRRGNTIAHYLSNESRL